jgi:hypothetical protein
VSEEEAERVGALAGRAQQQQRGSGGLAAAAAAALRLHVHDQALLSELGEVDDGREVPAQALGLGRENVADRKVDDAAHVHHAGARPVEGQGRDGLVVQLRVVHRGQAREDGLRDVVLGQARAQLQEVLEHAPQHVAVLVARGERLGVGG